MPNLPLLIWEAAEGGTPAELSRVWGIALVLLGLILIANIAARAAAGAQPEENGAMSIDPPDQIAPPRRRLQPTPAPAPPPAVAATAGLTNGVSHELIRPAVFDITDMSVHYGPKRALAWTTLKIYRNLATAVIGPSGCGKSTFLRSLNRMNDSIPGFRVDGQILYHGHDLYNKATNRVEVRRRIGMVFQKPNPFPKSIYDNIAWAPAQPRAAQGARRARREGAAPGGAVGRGQGSTEVVGAEPVRRAAAATLHRPRDRGRARRAAARRARIGA